MKLDIRSRVANWGRSVGWAARYPCGLIVAGQEYDLDPGELSIRNVDDAPQDWLCEKKALAKSNYAQHFHEHAKSCEKCSAS